MTDFEAPEGRGEPRRLIQMPVSEPGNWLDAPDLAYVSDLPPGPVRSRIETILAERISRFAYVPTINE